MPTMPSSFSTPEASPDHSQVRLTLAYRGGWPPGFARTQVTVETDDPRQPKIEIPVFANVVGAAANP